MTDNDFIKVCEESNSMRDASIKLDIPFTTFKRRALKLGCYKTNQSGKGVPCIKSQLDIQPFLNNEKNISSWKMKQLLFRDNLIENVCSECGLSGEWNGKPISLHLDHIDGNSSNNSLDNLRLLCPNCHSQTETYCGKNKSGRNLTDEDYLEVIPKHSSVASCMKALGKRPQKHHYKKIEKLCEEYNVSLKD